MPFISFSFAVFFVAVAALYHLAPSLGKNALRVQQILLFAAGIVFYAFADLRFLPFLFYVTAVSYLAGLFVRNRFSLALFVIADLLPLLFFKYAPQDWHMRWVFPLGLSFFTFQSVSYIADVYTKKIAAEKNPLMVTLFVGFFPTIASGPIQRAPVLLPQLKEIHRFDYDNATDGMRLFAWGMFKKLVIADRIAVYVDYVYGNIPGSHGLALLLATVLYSFQIYCDFSGYSDMAIGVARYFGFDAGRNFDHPYLSQSVGEFWRRWHISLSSWLRDYVYIPLGGSRVALPRVYLNLMITFLVSGVWHGAGWTFVAWGLLHGAYQCIGRATKPLQERLRIPAAVRIAITFCLVSFAWIFFRAGSMGEVLGVIRGIANVLSEIAQLIPYAPITEWKMHFKEVFALTDPEFGFLKGMAKVLALLAVLLGIELATQREDGLRRIKRVPIGVRWIGYVSIVVIVIVILSFAAKSTNTEFLYFQF